MFEFIQVPGRHRPDKSKPAIAYDGHRVVPRRIVRSLLALAWSRYDTPFERLVRLVLPWHVRTYPGLYRGLRQIMGERVSYGAIAHWRSGRQPVPDWAAAMILDYARSRAAGLIAAADELDAAMVRQRAERAKRRNPRPTEREAARA